MPARKGLLAPQNTFLDTIATRFDGTHSNFVLGNAKIANVPIVYCSDGFCELTGKTRAQIMQKPCACDFLWGQKTDVQNREAILRALESKQELKLEVILYRHSGVPFWCLLDIVPIQDEKHEVVLFLCSHKDITKQKKHQQMQQQRHFHQQQHQQQQVAPEVVASSGEHATANQLMEGQQRPQNAFTPSATTAAATSAATVSALASKAVAVAQGATIATSSAAPPLAALLAADAQAEAGATGSSSNELQPNYKSINIGASNASSDQNNSNNNQSDANQQSALISMDEFGILEDSGGENEFGDETDDSEDHDKQTTSQYSRRRSRAVLYQLGGHYGYGRRDMKSKLKLNSNMRGNIPEYKTTTIEKQKFILSHYGFGKACWDWLILVVSFYVAIVVPYNAAFKVGPSKDKPKNEITGEQCKIDRVDILVEVVFLIDVLLNFRTTFVNRKGEVVTRPKTICRHYVRGWFLVDFCAAVPFDLLCSLNLYSRLQYRIDLNLLKLIRLLRLARLLQKMDRYSQYSYIILTLLMLIFSLLAHWCACFWYGLAIWEIDTNPPSWKIGWIHQLSEKLGYKSLNDTDMYSSYVTALYFTTSSLTSVGFGNVSANTNSEKIFSIMIMLIGALMHAVIFGSMTAMIRVMYARRSNYQTRLRDLKDFFRLHQLPKELQQRMSDYFQTTWSLNHGIEIHEILKDFPEELRGDVSLHLHREVLSLPIFETAPPGFLKSLARHIESKFCCPTEYLIHRGDALGYLYLVCNGSMEVLQDNMVVAILGKGDLVGYDVNALSTPEQTQFSLNKMASSISSLAKSSSDLKALTYCDLKCIHITGLLEVLKLYPEFSDTFHKEIMHDLTFNLRECHDEQLQHQQPLRLIGANNNNTNNIGSSNTNVSASNGQLGSGGAGNGRRSPPPPNFGHLTRSIKAASDENQIGRYGDESGSSSEGPHELAEDEAEEDEDEEDEDEEGEEEDEDDELGAGNDSDDQGEEPPGSGDGGAGQAHAVPSSSSPENDANEPNADHTRQQQQQKDRPVEAAGRPGKRSANRKRAELRCLKSWRQKLAADSLLSDGEQEPVSLASPRRGQLNDGLRRRLADDEWRSSHSYDGLLDCRRKAGQRGGGAGSSGPTAIQSPVSGARLRPAIGGARAASQQQAADGGGANRKPLLSFDLSRNTTAIVDRRRSSAGCIVGAKQLLVGAQQHQRKPRAKHSSLIHINEDSLDQVAPGDQQRPSARRQAKSGQQQSQQLWQPLESLKSEEPETGPESKRKEELKSIEARISGISASVLEMKLELRQELEHFRSSMSLLMQLVANNNEGLSSNQSRLANTVATTLHGGQLDSGAAGSGAALEGLEGVKEAQMLRSLSTASLPLGAASAGADQLFADGKAQPEGEAKPGDGSRERAHVCARTLDAAHRDNEQAPATSLSGSAAVEQAAATFPMEPLIKGLHPVGNSSSRGARQHQRIGQVWAPTMSGSIQQQSALSAGNIPLFRPTSQTSSSSPPSSIIGANLNSDNDSGRSSSSVNFLAAGGQLKSATSNELQSQQPLRQIVVQTSSASNPLAAYPTTAFEISSTQLLRHQQSRQGRPAKILLTSTTKAPEIEQQQQRFTIQMKPEQLAGNQSQASQGGGSLV